MKRLFILIMVMLMFFSFTACGKDAVEPLVKEIEISGQTGTMTFDQNTYSAGTITMENGEYRFIYDIDGTVTITYPDGYIYTQKNINGGIATPADYSALDVEAKGYIDGLSLVWGIESAMDYESRGNSNSASPLLAIILMGLGTWVLFAPNRAWWLARGWWYKNAEPSDMAIGFYRVAGGLLMMVGIICMIAAF
ncbi:MAG: hypothetical protein VB100_01695 [Angelakisella sp.]|nr:hypothetical protein [Angelakisella sp.]